jgi:hypothetical protein
MCLPFTGHHKARRPDITGRSGREWPQQAPADAGVRNSFKYSIRARVLTRKWVLRENAFIPYLCRSKRYEFLYYS